MKDVSNSILRSKWRGWSTPSPPVPVELEVVAAAFVLLQEARHEADYDNSKIWFSSDVLGLIADTREAFENWTAIRINPAANEYLLSLLIGIKRE